MKNFLSFFIYLLPFGIINAQPEITIKFLYRSHTFQGTTLPYRLFVPESYNPLIKYPLVLALHGSGERGSDNERHIASHRLATSWADPINQAKYPCFVIAPQCTEGGSWINGIFNQTPISPELATANNIIDSLVKEFNIDTDRLYVTGLSLGGFGTWDLVMRYPDRFAAAIPMSGGGDTTGVSLISKLPIWNFHGRLDEPVPIQYSRNMINALVRLGRTPIYTHCSPTDCIGLTNVIISYYINNHSDLFFTEYEFGSHIIWAESYDYPFLFPWVFDKRRIQSGAIRLTNLCSHLTLTGIFPILWSAKDTIGSIEIWFSPDAGDHWTIIANNASNSGEYLWNTSSVSDCSFGLLKLFLKDSKGSVVSYDQSRYFTIKNKSTGSPFVKIMNPSYTAGTIYDRQSLRLELLIGDTRQDSLALQFLYSIDNKKTFTLFESKYVYPDTNVQLFDINIALLPNSDSAAIKAIVSNGTTTYISTTGIFIKRTARLAGQKPVHTDGSAGAIISVRVVDQSKLTSDRYRITFRDSLRKSYDVYNLTKSKFVVQNAYEIDGITEGPLFDGIRLIVKDFDPTQIDKINSKWLIGTATIPIIIDLPTIITPTGTLRCIPYPADYQIRIFNSIVDTSESFLGVPPMPMKFTLWNMSENRKASVLYADLDRDQTISNKDQFYILERTSNDSLALSWHFYFFGLPEATIPQQGDVFQFSTLKPLTHNDVYEFEGILSGLSNDNSINPKSFELLQNYPNPFNPTTTFKYRIPSRTFVTLQIYDLLGRKVATLLKEMRDVGEYSAKWNASQFPSGIYFCTLQAEGFRVTRRMILLK